MQVCNNIYTKWVNITNLQINAFHLLNFCRYRELRCLQLALLIFDYSQRVGRARLYGRGPVRIVCDDNVSWLARRLLNAHHAV